MSSLACEWIDGVPVARVNEDIDATNAAAVQRELAQAPGPTASSLVIDLSRVRYLGSAGIDMLLRLNGRLDQRRAKLILVIPGFSQLTHLATIAGLSDVVIIYPTLGAAVRAAVRLQTQSTRATGQNIVSARDASSAVTADAERADPGPHTSAHAPRRLEAAPAQAESESRQLRRESGSPLGTPRVGAPLLSAESARALRTQLRLDIDVTVDSDVRTITLAGEADLLSAPQIEAACKDAASGAPKRVVIDLRALTFIDSSGLHALVTGHELCRACGQMLEILPGPANVQRLFEIAGVDEVLPFCDAGRVGDPSQGDAA